MNNLLAQSLFALLEYAATKAPDLIDSVSRMFSKGVPTVEEIQAEKAKVLALTLDDVQPPAAEAPPASGTV